MAQALATNHIPPKHDIHKFRDIKPKLGKDNWMSWKRELLATARDRGIHKMKGLQRKSEFIFAEKTRGKSPQ